MMLWNQSSKPAQNVLSYRTIGCFLIFSVCIKVKASNSSSIVPNPPGITTKAWLYFTNMTFRTKK